MIAVVWFASTPHHVTTQDALGWGTVQVSAVLGFNSILNMAMTILAAILVRYFSDTTMVVSGFFCWLVAGLLMVRQDIIHLTHQELTETFSTGRLVDPRCSCMAICFPCHHRSVSDVAASMLIITSTNENYQV